MTDPALNPVLFISLEGGHSLATNSFASLEEFEAARNGPGKFILCRYGQQIRSVNKALIKGVTVLESDRND